VITSIYTETEQIPNESQRNTTGTDLPNNKRGLDTVIGASIGHLLALAEVLIKGTLPEVNYNRIIKTTVSSTAQTLAFVYNGSYQFYMDATLIYGDYDVSVRTTRALTLERGLSRLQLESSTDTLGLEST